MEKTIKLGCAVLPVAIGDVHKNVQDICAYIEKAAQENCQIVLFPELALTGYTCGDLFFQQLLRSSARGALKELSACSALYPQLTAVVGLPLELSGALYNCAAVLRGGQVLGIVPKMYLTDHRESPEGRWFAAGDKLKITQISAKELGLDDYSVPVGAGQIFDLDGVKLGVEICEDLFVEESPSFEMAKRGAQIILNPAASVQLVGKQKFRRELVQEQSKLCDCVYAFCSAGCTESTRDTVYSGHSIIARRGTVIAENKELVDTDYLLCAPVRVLSAAPSGKRAAPQPKPLTKQPFDVSQTACREMFTIQSAGLACRLKQLNANAVIGVSGGLDSTLALLVAVEAMKRLDRPATDVYAVTMPCFGTSDRTYQNALELMKLLGVTVKEINIRNAVMQHFSDIGHDPEIHNATYENAQARERTQILMDYASRVGGIVVGTGDLSELALGWCTYNGDHMSMYGVNASIPKTVMAPMIRTVSQMDQYRSARTVLEDIIATPISPELLPVDGEGKIAQKTEDLVGPYALHDFFLYYIVKDGCAPEQVYDMACRAFADEFDVVTIKKWLKVFYRRFFTQQFKRSCMPEGVKVTEVSLSPRGDWLMPSDAAVRLWLEEVEKL
ncbi:MAG: NAD(+) synthase [Oscillospiraceae bacterium]|nr:NAD(+) synthase [Oscillospiraceae bacterium]